MIPSVTALWGIVKTDTLRLCRERFLLGMTAYFFVIFLVLRYVILAITSAVASEWQFDLTPYHPLIVSHFVVQLAPWLPGMIGGFLYLESRETGTIHALHASPTSLLTYLSVTCLGMFALAVAASIIAARLTGLQLPAWPALVGVALAAAPAGPAVALLLATLAKNKVQAFAYLKLLGTFPLAATGIYFLAEEWHWWAAVYPPFCAAKAYWAATGDKGPWLPWMVAALAGSALWLIVLGRWFLKATRTNP